MLSHPGGTPPEQLVLLRAAVHLFHPLALYACMQSYPLYTDAWYLTSAALGPGTAADRSTVLENKAKSGGGDGTTTNDNGTRGLKQD